MEVTSYGQMDAIMEYGCYEIGIKQPVICKSQNEVISLTLKMTKEEEEKYLKTSYSLEDLQDLESKLVLITGTNADNRKMVDLYVDVSKNYQNTPLIFMHAHCFRPSTVSVVSQSS